MRRTGTPCIVTSKAQHFPLKRVEFSDQRILENYLQENLHKSPGILPIEELDGSFAPLVSLGREITNIDNLFISPTGNITLVETKLWRNPEATRTVVAQVLEYAARLKKWTYADLENNSRGALAPAPIGSESLYDFVGSHFPDEMPPEREFVDAVRRNLRDAKFLLLVVGDGIKENLEDILDFHRQPQMLYKFGLVEIRVFESPAIPDGRLLLPMVVAKTTEIERAIVRVLTTGPAPVSVSVEAQVETPTTGARRTLSESLFFEEIKDEKTVRLFQRLLAFVPEIDAELTWGASAVSIRLPDPKEGKRMLTLFLLNTNGEISTGWLASQLSKVSIDEAISHDFVKKIAALFPGITPHKKYPDSLSRSIKSSELEPKIDEFISIVRDTVAKIQQQAAVKGS